MFINLSNHPSSQWSEEQRNAARQYGEIRDIPFPDIPPHLSSDEIDRLADEYYGLILGLPAKAVMLQGEFVFAFRLITRLKSAGITVLAACSERKTVEYTDESGASVKQSRFSFVGFREY